MKKIILFTFIVSIVFNAKITFSQTKIDSTEITSSVPALSDFHEIIYPMWHEAYPAKDIAALKAFVPQIKTAVEKINKAELPGILKDKKEDWEKQLKEFNSAAEDYYKAAEGTTDTTLLTAAENLHYNFEMMMRVIKPVLKVIDNYHQSLYIIYHKLYPEKKYDEIALGMDNLIAKADSIVKYPQDKLKKRLGDNVAKFDTAAKELYDATVALKEALKGTVDAKKDESILNVHSKYQALEAIFK
jgi:hypothetical protein